MNLKERLISIAKDYDLSVREFELQAGLNRGNISNMTGAIGSDKLSKIIDAFPDLNLYWLVTGEGEKFRTKSTENAYKLNVGENVGGIVGKPKVQKKPTNKVADFKGSYTAGESDDMTTIPIVDIAAAAGAGAYNGDFVETVDTLRLPAKLLHKGTHNCIYVKGQSMSPTIQDGSYLIIRLLDRSEWIHIKNDYIYVVTNRENETFIKRVRNRLREHGFIVCCSDNPDKVVFPNFNIPEADLHNVWVVEWYMTAKMPNIHATYYSQMQDLRDDVDDIKEILQRFLKKPGEPV